MCPTPPSVRSVFITIFVHRDLFLQFKQPCGHVSPHSVHGKVECCNVVFHQGSFINGISSAGLHASDGSQSGLSHFLCNLLAIRHFTQRAKQPVGSNPQQHQQDHQHSQQVISSMIPNDDFGGFEPLRLQKPGYYQPNSDVAQASRYMCMTVPYMARGPGHLTVPGGSKVFLYDDQDKDGMATVIYDGQRGLVPMSLLKPADIKMTKGKTESTLATGIPHPPGLKPPSRPKNWSRSATPNWGGQISSDMPPPSYSTATYTQLPAAEPPKYTTNSASSQDVASVQEAETDSVLIKVHYVYTVAVSVPSNASYHELKEEIAQQLDQPASSLRLRQRKPGSRLLVPLEWELEAGRTVQEVSEGGRTTVWCQAEDSLQNHTILYQMVALYDYSAQGPEDLEFSEGDTIDILCEVNDEWLEGHCAGNIGIFPSSFAMRENENFMHMSEF
ncbi:NADPH oxidase activator 1 isoform X3 [Festucalex cinctus]